MLLRNQSRPIVSSAFDRAFDTLPKTELRPGKLRGWERPERPRVDSVLLHLEVQGFVVGSEQSRRLALVPPGGLEDPVDRPPLGVCRGRLGDLLERGVEER